MKPKQEVKREALLQASLSLIMEKGFQQTSVSDIVKRAGLAQGTFYLYFPTKNDLVPAVADHILQQLLSRIQKDTAGLTKLSDKLHAIINATFEMNAVFKEVILLCYSGLAYHHSFPRWEEIYEPYYIWFREQVQQALDQGEIEVNYHIPYMVRMLINMVEVSAETAHFVDIPQGKSEKDINIIKETLLQAMERSLGVIRTV
ncbi:TetR family transcriptional regulator [Paenibacillus marinisediminis]